MCHFVTIACPAPQVPTLKRLLRGRFGLIPTENRSVLGRLPENWTAVHVVEGMCSCSLFQDPDERVERDVEADIARFRERHRKPGHRKHGWTEVKIQRAAEDIRAARRRGASSSFMGVRDDLRLVIADLVRLVAGIALAVHWYDGDVHVEGAVRETAPLDLDRFVGDPASVHPDVLYRLAKRPGQRNPSR